MNVIHVYSLASLARFGLASPISFPAFWSGTYRGSDGPTVASSIPHRMCGAVERASAPYAAPSERNRDHSSGGVPKSCVECAESLDDGTEFTPTPWSPTTRTALTPVYGSSHGDVDIEKP